MVINFRRKRGAQSISINRAHVERFLGTSISGDWGPHLDCQHISIYKGAAETPFTVEEPPRGQAAGFLLPDCHRTSVDVLRCCLIFTVQKVTRTAEKIISCPQPHLENIAGSRCLNRAKKMLTDRFHPALPLFKSLPFYPKWLLSNLKTLPSSPKLLSTSATRIIWVFKSFLKGERIAHALTELWWLFHHCDCRACTGSMGRRSCWTRGAALDRRLLKREQIQLVLSGSACVSST